MNKNTLRSAIVLLSISALLFSFTGCGKEISDNRSRSNSEVSDTAKSNVKNKIDLDHFIDSNFFTVLCVTDDGKVLMTKDPEDDVKERNNLGYLDKVKEWEDITAISVGDDYVVGLKRDGGVCYTNKKGSKTPEWSGIIKVMANGKGVIVGLKEDGTVVCEGLGSESYQYVDDEKILIEKKFEASEWTDIIDIDFKGGTLLGLKSDGTVKIAGNVEYGKDGAENWNDIIKVYAGEYIVAGIDSIGNVHALGTTLADQVGTWTNVDDIFVNGVSIYGLSKDGTILTTLFDGPFEGDKKYVDYPNWNGIKEFSEHHSGNIICLFNDGTVRTSGVKSAQENFDTHEWTDIIKVYALADCVVGLRADGELMVSFNSDGKNHYGSFEEVKDWKPFNDKAMFAELVNGLNSEVTGAISHDEIDEADKESSSVEDETISEENDTVSPDMWQQAYIKFLNDYKSSSDYSSYAMWDLVDLDGNEVPELLISGGDFDAAEVEVYYFEDNDVKKVSDEYHLVGHGGVVTFCNSEKLIMAARMHMGNESTNIYQFTGNALENIYNSINTYAALGDDGECTVNGTVVSEEEYYQAEQEYTSKDWETIGRNYTFDDFSVLGDVTNNTPEITEANKCGDNVYWSIEGTVLKITGTGDMYDYAVAEPYYNPENATPFRSIPMNDGSYTPSTEIASIKSVEISEGITSIGTGAFACTEIETITLPDTLLEIKDSAFQYSSYLKDITIPANVKSIGQFALDTGQGWYPALSKVTILSRDCVIYDEQTTINSSYNDFEPSPTVIVGYSGSSAEEYAVKYDRAFESID